MSLESHNPATGQTIQSVPVTSTQDLTKIFKTARQAQAKWSALSLKKRASILVDIKETFLDHADELIDLVVEENGKPGFGIWVVERSGKTWSSPELITASVRDSSPGWQVSLDNNSHIYFSTRGVSDIYISRYLDGTYIKPENLGPSINTEYNDNDPFVDKHGEYMVFSSNRLMVTNKSTGPPAFSTKTDIATPPLILSNCS